MYGTVVPLIMGCARMHASPASVPQEGSASPLSRSHTLWPDDEEAMLWVAASPFFMPAVEMIGINYKITGTAPVGWMEEKVVLKNLVSH